MSDKTGSQGFHKIPSPLADERLARGDECGRCQWWRVSVISGIPRCDQDGRETCVGCYEELKHHLSPWWSWSAKEIKETNCLEQYIFLIRDTQFRIQDLFPANSKIIYQSLFSPHGLHWQFAQQDISKCKFNKIQPFTRKTNHQIHKKAKHI